MVVVLDEEPAAPLPVSPSAAAASARRGCLGKLLLPRSRRPRLTTTVLAMLLCVVRKGVKRECGCNGCGWGMILLSTMSESPMKEAGGQYSLSSKNKPHTTTPTQEKRCQAVARKDDDEPAMVLAAAVVGKEDTATTLLQAAAAAAAFLPSVEQEEDGPFVAVDLESSLWKH